MAIQIDDEKMPERLTKKSQNMSRWYTDVVRMAKMADYAPVRGCMVVMPYGYALWENIQKILDARFKATGHVNAYFPLLIPESFLQKEAEHVEGFAPEVAWVTNGGGEDLEERLAIRPTSEAIICHMYSKWIRSYRDLPVLINQWANILRWEKVTRLFLRTTEFLWQEGHTAHATAEEAEQEALGMLEIYREFMESELAMPVIVGRKSESEKFAGATATYALEALMSDGKALQAGTTHDLGQNFAKAFEIKFSDRDEQQKYVWQTSWGVSTRMIGGLVMTHGDDAGLIFPPRVAPTQVVVVPIWGDDTREAVGAAARDIADRLGCDFRVEADLRDEYRPGWKFSEHEMRGVPLRLEIGPKDIEKGQVVAVRRDTKEKIFIPNDAIEAQVGVLLETIQQSLYDKAVIFRDQNTFEVNDLNEMRQAMRTKRGFMVAHWCGDPACEQTVKDETKATVRVLPFAPRQSEGACVVCGKPGKRAYFAQAY
jgi:prolyl-tRNA synthetase